MAASSECMRESKKHLVKPARSIAADGRKLQLKIAKQILAEVFDTRLCDVDDMIMRRLGEKELIADSSRLKEKEICQYDEMYWMEENRSKENGNHAQWGRWPEMFQVEDEL